MVSRVVKRIFDYAFAVCVGVFAIPVILITMIVIRIVSPEAPAMFKQERIGYRCIPFTICKLRSMTNETDENGDLLPDYVRTKKWGHFIRKFSLDELSQIFNILAGRMSWIGPRPLLPQEMLVMTEEEQRERQSVLPGITGWEAVNEEKTDSRREMAEYDLYYVRNWSIGLDVKIFFLTIRKLLGADRSDEEHRAPKLNEMEFQSTEIVREVERYEQHV